MSKQANLRNNGTESTRKLARKTDELFYSRRESLGRRERRQTRQEMSLLSRQLRRPQRIADAVVR